MANGLTYKSRLLYRLERFGDELKPVEQAVGQRNPRERRIILVAIVILVVGLVTFWWQAHAGSKSSFVTAAIKRGSVTSTIAAAGTIEPVEVVDVGAQVAGQISAFGTDKSGKPIDYRSVVAAGHVLAEIDHSLYAADLAVAKGQLERDKAGELSAQANLDQTKAKLHHPLAGKWGHYRSTREYRADSRGQFKHTEPVSDRKGFDEVTDLGGSERGRGRPHQTGNAGYVHVRCFSWARISRRGRQGTPERGDDGK